MSVRFSRGCPFDCEFCDIVVMNGRVPRTKSQGRLETETTGNNTQAALNFRLTLSRTFLITGYRERLAYWRFCIATLRKQPRQFHHALELAIIGHHFRRVARLL